MKREGSTFNVNSFTAAAGRVDEVTDTSPQDFSFAAQLAEDHPLLNVLINTAGIMRPGNLLVPQEDLADAEATVTTNLLGPIRCC